jgi:hypothetical protein
MPLIIDWFGGGMGTISRGQLSDYIRCCRLEKRIECRKIVLIKLVARQNIFAAKPVQNWYHSANIRLNSSLLHYEEYNFLKGDAK